MQGSIPGDLASGRLAWLPLGHAETLSQICSYQRVGQTAGVATRMFVDVLDDVLAAMHLNTPVSGDRTPLPARGP